MKFIVPIPDSPYYLWQALVQMAHFRELGYEEDVHYPIVYFGDRPSDLLLRLWEADEVRAFLHLYPDTRADTSYPASMKPWLMGKFFEQFPDEVTSVYHYLDPDCILTRPMDFTPFAGDDRVWHGSDTRSYTGVEYIRAKGEQLFLDLCQIAGVAPEDVIAHDHNTIGAQYFVRGADADFWFTIERNSIAAYRHMVETTDRYHPAGHRYPIQAWCAEMYLQQFETIRAGFTPVASDLMTFCWANAPAEAWDEHQYFHDAGQPEENGRDFCKTTWQSSPFRKDIRVSPSSSSYRYVELIRRTEAMFPGLIWD
jgi:hypothetical protein